jgi:hypothetical protein
MTAWREIYEGGGQEAEWLLFDKLAVDIMGVQYKNQKHTKVADQARAYHIKAVYTEMGGELCFEDDLPLRITADGHVHDFLVTSYPLSQARNARQFVAFAQVGAAPAPTPNALDPNFLAAEFVARLGQGEVRFDLCVQPFVSENPLVPDDYVFYDGKTGQV